MKPTQGYYSIIQYCPDLGRFEVANIGVLLFCPEIGFLKAMTAKNNRRISHFFGKEHDWKRINILKRGIADRLKKEQGSIQTIDDLRSFISLRANLLQITPPNSIRVEDPEQELRDLFQEVIGETSTRSQGETLPKLIEKRLMVAGVQEKLVQKVAVEIPLLQKRVEFPFGFQNGRFNVIQTARFSAKSSEHSINAACKYAVEGREIFDHPDEKFGDMQLYVVAQFRQEDHETPPLVQRVFKDYQVKLYKTDELPELVDEIRRNGKVLQ